MSDTDPIPISALNHFAYCPRRCGLIHIEGEFTDNIHTARGEAEHERVDRETGEITAGVRVEYALPVYSDRLNLVGKCDVVEIRADGTLYPVEYKHGPRRKWLNDDIQVCAQALCLEEMTGNPVPRGAIYHVSSRRRREVEFTESLRRETEAAVGAVRVMLKTGELPPPVNDKRCRECSLKEICQPEAIASRERAHLLAATLYRTDA